MKTDELRQAYLKFFEARGHKIMPSASLIPAGDPTLLLTAAGMVPFKPYFLGTAKPDHLRAVTCQKCVRTGDIENVGRTTRHATFFEMLGNFSFGDYFKADAITWGWEFVTRVLGFSPEQLWITIYLDDDEAFEIWNNTVGVPADRIVRKGKKDNFWEIGVGPCGPCSEIHVDRGASVGCGSADCGLDCDCGRFIEIWNLVFIQFHRDEQGNYTSLEHKGIDTGMGLERVAAVLQDVPTIFDTDETRVIRNMAAELGGAAYGEGGLPDMAVRVITDHVRASVFMVGDGILPTNEGRGYVLRRLLRRAARYGKLIGIEGVFLPKVAGAVIDVMHGTYPELADDRERILRTIQLEEERFLLALDQGSAVLESVIARVLSEGGSCVPGADAFRLYDTFGFPFELTVEIAGERGLTVDQIGFDKAMEAQRERARAARGDNAYLDEASERYHAAIGEASTEFVGYDRLAEQARVIAVIGADGAAAQALRQGEQGEIVLDRTPFYAASGGQQADTGIIAAVEGGREGDGQADAHAGAVAQVVGASRPLGDAVVHAVRVTRGRLAVGDVVTASVDEARRAAIRRNHTATHLLHAALRQVLGSHVQQAGSHVDDERLRFDFSHFEAVSLEQLAAVERLVNDWALANIPVDVNLVTLDEAHSMGAMALFDEKYGNVVRVVRVGDVSLELCGGTHVARTGDIGMIKIVSEGGIAAGVRRIEAVTGLGALDFVNRTRSALHGVADILKVSEDSVAARVDRLMQDLHDREREVHRLTQRLAAGSVDSIVAAREMVGDVAMVAAPVDVPDAEGLRNLADQIRDRLGSGIVLLGAVTGDKLGFVACVTRDLVELGYNAGAIAREAARAAGGGGGGRPDMAQAGGRDVSKLDTALAAGVDAVRARQAAQSM
ncbi:MAG: alanine--tRNA ligase [Firmicutes bacterium]|nr:alanine--tRNA ligase [Bacillota bacterium]